RGGALVMVTVADERASELTSVLESYGAQNVEDESAGVATRAPQASSAAASTGRTAQAQGADTAIPVVEEELQVGKRQVQRGGVRVYSHVVETPVEETVRLREERVNVDRRPVNRPASEADFAGFKEGTVEMTETAEEAVVSKNARVVEEVVIGKDATERTETIRDNVRRTEVEVEQLGADRSGTRGGYAGNDAAYRNHFQTNYATTGAAYNDYAPAYQYGSELGNDPRYKSGDWDTTEAAVKNNWSSRGRGTWEEVKGAVRHGWESVRNTTTGRS
ncbi:MAG: YsnF/AvaK domain-containing protein, partial [Acidobacteriota bacterium]|nr:YsnF/AvaK domain-containing protein [Acidobacteriota bacterium]